MTKAVVEISAAALSLVGVLVGVYGTYVLTKWYHPFGWWSFTMSIVVMFWRKITFAEAKSERVNKTAAALAGMTPENRAESLHGLHWIFLGFLLQTAGAALAMVDAFLPKGS
jgi:hypothetical protein